MEGENACAAVDDALDRYLDAELDGETRAAVERHLSACEQCRRRLEVARRLRDVLPMLPVEEPRADFFADAFDRAGRRPRGPRLAAAGFIGAFGLSILTVLLTGLAVHAPRSRETAPVATVTLKPNRVQTVNLVFDARSALDDVVITVDLPSGVEVPGHDGDSRIQWETRLVAGTNLVPLEVVAKAGRGGRLVARLRHGDDEKQFVVKLSVDRS